MVFADEINANTVVSLNPTNGELRVVKLPTENTGIRKMIVDAGGRVWYMGSHSGKLGMIQ
jgi:virginiamycin B lyase